MRIIAAIAAVALSGAAITGTAWAHHGWESYDSTKQQKVTGAIAELKWEQPHAILWVNRGGKKQVSDRRSAAAYEKRERVEGARHHC